MKEGMPYDMDANQFPISLLGQLEMVNAQQTNKISLRRRFLAFILTGEVVLRVGDLFPSIFPSTFDGHSSTLTINFANTKPFHSSRLAYPNAGKPLPPPASK